MKKLSVEEYILALEKMKRSPRDRLGILGELSVGGLGVTAGIALSSTVAGAAGAATLAGSTALASLLGWVLVTSTPVGWVVGSAVVCGSLAYAAGKLVRSGGKCDTLKAETVREIERQILTMQKDVKRTHNYDDKISAVITSIQHLVVNGLLSQEKGTEILAAVEKNSLDVDDAFELLQDYLIEQSSGTTK
jgi:hypothetical protein